MRNWFHWYRAIWDRAFGKPKESEVDAINGRAKLDLSKVTPEQLVDALFDSLVGAAGVPVDAARQVLVGPRRMQAVSAAVITETNRLGPLPDGPLMAKVRSMAQPVPVTLDGPIGGGADCTVRFVEPAFGVAPGQAAVIYAGDRVIGGGWIETSTPA